MSYDTITLANTFFDGAGIYPSTLQLGIRGALLFCILLWAAWIILGTLQSLHQTDMTGSILVGRLISVLVIVSGCLVLIFI